MAASISANSLPNNLPFLPGYRIDDNRQRDRYHKRHMFDVSNGVRVDVSQDPAVVSSGANGALNTSTLQIAPQPRSYVEAMDSKHATPQATMTRLPAWVAYDRKVLRFFGYFKEAVHASAAETWRLRKVIVYFYLEDDSMHIAEPKVENSGIPQGVFVKRHRIPKEGNVYFSVDDLFIGAELSVYGRVFRLVDCDDFTRAFFSENGSPLGNGEPYPFDSFAKKSSTTSHTHHKLMNPLKNFMEATLGKPMGAGIEANQKFLMNDGKVLRFYCQWDDDKMYGEKKPFILHYFLADDTAEVLEVQQPNSGRDPFPCLLKRQKLPKDFTQTLSDCSKIGIQDDSNVGFYNERDFRVGNFVNVYGRNLFICGADAFTIDYYKANYGLSDADFPRLNMDDPPPRVTAIEPPPYTGFGTDEDSLGSFLYLMPKVPKQDFKKLVENDGMNIRFMAKFVSPAKVDRDRRFIVTYYMNNDTISVFEKFERNSGFVGGKFLERARFTNPRTREYFFASDLFIGATLRINHYEFELIDCDEYTLKFMQNNPNIFTTRNGPTSQ